MDSLTLNIGDLPTSFLFIRSGVSEELARRYRSFLISYRAARVSKRSAEQEGNPLPDGPPSLQLRRASRRTEPAEALAEAGRGSDCPCWHFQVSVAPEMIPSEGLPYHEVRIQLEGRELKLLRPDFEANLDLGTCQGTLCYAGPIPSFENFLRALYSVRLLEVEGLLIHAASIEREGAAHLFVGRSGAGKSTIAQLSRARILTDEISLVRSDGDQFYLYGTPFWGELRGGGEMVRFPLRTVNFLHKDGATFAKDVRLSEAIRKLLQCTLFFSAQKEWRRQLLVTAERICGRHRCQDLHFQQGREFLTLLDAGQTTKN